MFLASLTLKPEISTRKLFPANKFLSFSENGYEWRNKVADATFLVCRRAVFPRDVAGKTDACAFLRVPLGKLLQKVQNPDRYASLFMDP